MSDPIVADVAAAAAAAATGTSATSTTSTATIDSGDGTTASQTSQTFSTFDTMPDKLAGFLQNSDFKSDWTNRRKVIFRSLWGIGAFFGIIILCFAYVVVRDKGMDSVVAGVLTTAMWILFTAYNSLLGAYCFGVHFDVTNFRKESTGLISKLIDTQQHK